MVLMDEHGLEAQGVAALRARRKMLKTFEVVRRKMGIDDPTVPPPPPPVWCVLSRWRLLLGARLVVVLVVGCCWHE